ncbi:MAG: SPOR domain-containing protein, partial [Nitrospinota bacterium]
PSSQPPSSPRIQRQEVNPAGPPVAESTSRPREAPSTRLLAPDEPAAGDAEPKYTLQVAAFREKKRAQKLLQDLARKGYEPYIVSTDNSQNESWHLVRIGRFSSAERARRYAQLLKERENISALVWKLRP